MSQLILESCEFRVIRLKAASGANHTADANLAVVASDRSQVREADRLIDAADSSEIGSQAIKPPKKFTRKDIAGCYRDDDNPVVAKNTASLVVEIEVLILAGKRLR